MLNLLINKSLLRLAETSCEERMRLFCEGELLSSLCTQSNNKRSPNTV